MYKNRILNLNKYSSLFVILVVLFSSLTDTQSKPREVPQIWIKNAAIFKSLVETGSSGEQAYLKSTGDGDCQGMSLGKNQVTVASGSLWDELFENLSPDRRRQIISKLDEPYRNSFRKILNHLMRGQRSKALAEARKSIWQNRSFDQIDRTSCETNSGRPGVQLTNQAKMQISRILSEADIQNQQRKGEASAARHSFKLAQMWRWKQSPLRSGGTNTACSRFVHCQDKDAILETMPNFREFLWFFDRTVNSRAYLDLLQDPIKAVPWKRSGVYRAERMARFALAFLSSCPSWQPANGATPIALCERYRSQYQQAQKNREIWNEFLNSNQLEENQIRLFNLAFIRSQFGSPISFWLSMNRRGTIAMGKGCASQKLFDLRQLMNDNGFGDGARTIKISSGAC